MYHWFSVSVVEAVSRSSWDSTADLGRRLHSWLDDTRKLFKMDPGEAKLYDIVGSILELIDDTSMLTTVEDTLNGEPALRSVFCMPTCTSDTPGGDEFGFSEDLSLSAEDVRLAVSVAVELGWLYAPPYEVTVSEYLA